MSDLSSDLAAQFLQGTIDTFRSNKALADKAIAQVADEKLHVSLDANTNSIAVIMKHVSGNLQSRWTDFLTSDGEKPSRNRDDEFVDKFAGRADAVEFWERGWSCLFGTLQSLRPQDLSATVTIRGEPHSVPFAIQRSLAHCGYHLGQIVLIARVLAGDVWQTLTIPRGGSGNYNRQVWGSDSYRNLGGNQGRSGS